MILYAGENVYPAEIESVLCEHPAVLEAAVIGVPDDRWGELVTAVVVRRAGRDLTERELRRHCAERLADFKVPRAVVWTEVLPRTPSGKIKKAELRAPLLGGARSRCELSRARPDLEACAAAGLKNTRVYLNVAPVGPFSGGHGTSRSSGRRARRAGCPLACR